MHLLASNGRKTSGSRAFDSRGSRYPMFQVSGSQNNILNGIWDQSPEILGTWTLWGPQTTELRDRGGSVARSAGLGMT